EIEFYVEKLLPQTDRNLPIRWPNKCILRHGQDNFAIQLGKDYIVCGVEKNVVLYGMKNTKRLEKLIILGFSKILGIEEINRLPMKSSNTLNYIPDSIRILHGNRKYHPYSFLCSLAYNSGDSMIDDYEITIIKIIIILMLLQTLDDNNKEIQSLLILSEDELLSSKLVRGIISSLIDPKDTAIHVQHSQIENNMQNFTLINERGYHDFALINNSIPTKVHGNSNQMKTDVSNHLKCSIIANNCCSDIREALEGNDKNSKIIRDKIRAFNLVLSIRVKGKLDEKLCDTIIDSHRESTPDAEIVSKEDLQSYTMNIRAIKVADLSEQLSAILKTYCKYRNSRMADNSFSNHVFIDTLEFLSKQVCKMRISDEVELDDVCCAIYLFEKLDYMTYNRCSFLYEDRDISEMSFKSICGEDSQKMMEMFKERLIRTLKIRTATFREE
ncbi:MAG: hypothetical protein MHMPM18_003217, partial [Marteilia pararefringens]